MKRVRQKVQILGFAAAFPLLLLILIQSGLADAASRQGGNTLPPFGYMGAASNDSLAIFTVPTHTLSTTFSLLPEGDYPYDATMTRDGHEVWVTGAIGDGVLVISTTSNTIVERFTTSPYGEYPVDVAFSEHGETAFISPRDNTTGADKIILVDTASYSITSSIPITSYYLGPGKMTVNHCTGELYVVNWYDDRFFVIDPTTQTVLHDLSIGTSMWDVVMDPTASLLYITDRGVDGVRVFNPATLVVSTTIPVGDDPWGIDITPDGRHIFVTNEDSHNVSVIDTATNSVILTIPLAADADPRDVDISADGAYAYVTSGAIAGNDVVYVIDVATLQLLPSIDVSPASDPNVIAVAPPFASLDPIASFTSNSPVPPGTPIQFTDTTLNNPTSWVWDFGDGLGNSTQQNPAYNYANPGTYTVTLVTTNACGTDTFVDTVTVGTVTPPDIEVYLPILIKED